MPTNQQIFLAILDLKDEVGDIKGEIGEMKGSLSQIANANAELSKRMGDLETARNRSAGAKSAWSTLGKYAFDVGKLVAAAILGAHFGGGGK